VIDLHAHILPGVDDGVATLEEARALARRAAGDGVRAIAATPHVRWDYPTSAETMERGVAELRRDFAAQAIPVEILLGGELDLEQVMTLPTDELRRFTLAGSGRYLLVEFPYAEWPLALEPAVLALAHAGITPVLAHPERNAHVQDRPERIQAAVEAGALVQVTAASLDGRSGRRTRAAAVRLLELRLVHVLASDAHGPEVREAGLAAAAAAVGDRELARFLTSEAPAAIVAGEPVPPVPRRRRRFGLPLTLRRPAAFR
jgi:protein-tyrosine phosphatase